MSDWEDAKDYLIIMTLGSGAIGATKKGFEKYQEYKK